MHTIKILLVDDEELIRMSLKFCLQQEGFSVTTAESGEEALECLQQHSFDLLLTDNLLTAMTGL